MVKLFIFIHIITVYLKLIQVCIIIADMFYMDTIIVISICYKRVHHSL